jgi:L-seryl-tRNA(Ser) seleniumtransferase
MPERSPLPSVDRLLRRKDAAVLIAEFGRSAMTSAIRDTLAGLRESAITRRNMEIYSEASVIARVSERLHADSKPTLRTIFNLTGTVLHTNLGRAPLPEEAIQAAAMVARAPSNLEFDLETGRRGDRDVHVEHQLCRLTGAEAATVVNNNAAAVMLVLNSLALNKEVPVSRGELIEIGGSFRLPDIMASSRCRLREIGTTNRTHLSDYQSVIGPNTGVVMKVHTSNYIVEGFTASVPESELARLCHERGVPFAVDLGSGTLVDLRAFGLPHEPTAAESLANGADLLTFSGDKLLGGPQAGMIVGRADLIGKIKRNPLKRALRVDKMTLAALSAVLRLYSNLESVQERVSTLRMLTRAVEEIRALAHRLRDPLASALAGRASVEVIECASQMGSGSLPGQESPSAGLSMRPSGPKRGAGAALQHLAADFRRLPVPAIGRLHEGALIFDLRCLEDETAFANQLAELSRLR